MADPDKELWVDLYRMAMMELENAKIAGRIGDARIEIAARLAKLRQIPGLHTVEKQAITLIAPADVGWGRSWCNRDF